jgi:hypothetical protein
LASAPSLLFHYWRFVPGADPYLPTRRAIVNEVIVPLFNDPALRAEADCIYARKYATDPPAISSIFLLEQCNEVRLFVASQPDRQARVNGLVAAHAAPPGAGHGPFHYPAKERAGFEDCVWYRRCLGHVTAAALDLHHSAMYADHQRFVQRLDTAPGLRGLTGPALHDYLLEHSPSYAGLGKDGWGRFWRDFHRWGPAPNLYPPGHLFENLLLVD